MAKKKTTKKSINNNKDMEMSSTNKSSKVPESRVGDSYISLALGIIVVVAIAAVVVAFVKGNDYKVDTAPLEETVGEITAEEQKYVLQEGEGLWDVAIKFYGDGFQWVKIVEVNNLENPDFIPPGTELIIPKLDISTESE